jgi:energy-coupling factor transporter ATP-binding protein EcfA2
MDLSNRPLLATRTDNRLYVSRPLSAEIIRAATGGCNILLLGHRGSGKTTELHQLASSLENGAPAVVVIDGRVVRSTLDLLRLVLHRLGIGSVPRDAWDFGDLSEPLAVLEAIREGLGNDRAYVLIDELDPVVVNTMFGRLRDELWRFQITWIVAANDADEAAYMTPPVDAFFERTFRIPGLTVSEVFELLKRRGIAAEKLLSVEDDDVNRSGRTEVTPREAIELGRLSTEDPATQKAMRGQASKAYAMGRPYSMAYTELEALGPVSASDERLLKRLGWTRERASQVLRTLETAGVVETFTEARGKPGRPRKLYRIKGLPNG